MSVAIAANLTYLPPSFPRFSRLAIILTRCGGETSVAAACPTHRVRFLASNRQTPSLKTRPVNLGLADKRLNFAGARFAATTRQAPDPPGAAIGIALRPGLLMPGPIYSRGWGEAKFRVSLAKVQRRSFLHAVDIGVEGTNFRKSARVVSPYFLNLPISSGV